MAIDLTGDMQIIDNAIADGLVCLLGTADTGGAPQISPKGSMMVFDAGRLAYWERSARSALANLTDNPKTVVYYRNTTKSERFPKGAVWRFYGEASILTDGGERDQVYARAIPGERDKDPDKKGAAVMIAVERITDLGGNIIQEL
ncbi:MAG: pyridoxamine 5'-phosphate oxidase family protein [Alphaproteobacteria bacterium]|nr:pyridoxamine 5'-phosphate oxidase family protein [Alphaproteobacteria bacterium]